MTDMSALLRLFGIVEMPTGLIMIGLGILITRRTKFPPWLGVAMQFMGIGLILAGIIAYFQPLGAEMSQHAVGLILIVTLVLVGMRFQRARNIKGNPQP